MYTTPTNLSAIYRYNASGFVIDLSQAIRSTRLAVSSRYVIQFVSDQCVQRLWSLPVIIRYNANQFGSDGWADDYFKWESLVPNPGTHFRYIFALRLLFQFSNLCWNTFWNCFFIKLSCLLKSPPPPPPPPLHSATTHHPPLPPLTFLLIIFNCFCVVCSCCFDALHF